MSGEGTSQLPPSKKKNPECIEWRSTVKDFAGHEKSFSLQIPMSDQDWTMIRTSGYGSGSAAKVVLMQVTHTAQPQVMTCGVPWKCSVCQGRATTSVNTPAFHGEADPPFVCDHCFLPICEKLECESLAHQKMQEIIQQEIAPTVQKEFGYDKVVVKQPSISSSSHHETCGNCGVHSQATKKLFRCARCRNGFYCSKECQVAHWKVHKVSCAPPVQIEDRHTEKCG
eukprot:scaffold2246_cov162-Amphora_coffeaeformis.AAC.11